MENQLTWLGAFFHVRPVTTNAINAISQSQLKVEHAQYSTNNKHLTMAEIQRVTLRGFARAPVASCALSKSHRQEFKDTSSN